MSTHTKLSADEGNVYLEDYERAIEDNLTTPLTAKTDAGKLKELAERFPFTDFHLTNETSDATFKIAYDYTSASVGWYRDGVGLLFSSQRNFPRPCKIMMTSCSGFKKNVSHLFN
jgi:hypothetical protein